MCTEIVSEIQNNSCTCSPPRSAKRRASDKDLPVLFKFGDVLFYEYVFTKSRGAPAPPYLSRALGVDSHDIINQSTFHCEFSKKKVFCLILIFIVIADAVYTKRHKK